MWPVTSTETKYANNWMSVREDRWSAPTAPRASSA